jgi:Ca2+-binding RTX toxin-like protein
VVFSYEVTDGTEAIAAVASLDLLPDGPDVVVVPPGGNGDDILTGGPGNDIIEGGNGDDQILGLGGNDILFGDEGNDQIVGGAGDDVVFGGEGEDQIFGDAGKDMLFGGEGNDVIFGGDGNDIIQGGEGNDLLLGQAGNDIIDGGKDNDTIHGGLGKDILSGGQDKDTFVFNTTAEAGNGVLADMIADFQVGDKIDLSSIDANLGLGGNQGFALLNQATFTDAGQLIFRHDGGNTILEGDVDGDNTADFRIDLVGIHNLTVSDFSGVA